MLKQNFMQAAQEGWDEGQAQAATLSGAIGGAVDHLTRPIKDKFRRMGRDLAQTITSARENFTQQFTGKPQGPGSAALPQMRGMAQSMGNQWTTGLLDDLDSMGPSSPGGGSVSNGFGMGSSASQFQRQTIPPAMRLGTLSAGTSPFELPMFGMGLQEHNMGMSIGTGAIAGNAAIRGLTGRAPFALPGAAMQRPSQFMRGFGGNFGMGGRGFARGTAAGVGFFGDKIGGALRRGGRGLGNPLVAGALIAADLAFNEGPEIGRQLGIIDEQPEVTGHNSRLYGMLQGQGVIDMPEYREGGGMADMGSMGGTRRGLTADIARDVAQMSSAPPDRGTIDSLGGDRGVTNLFGKMNRAGMSSDDMMGRLRERHGVGGTEAYKLLRSKGMVEGPMYGGATPGDSADTHASKAALRLREAAKDPTKLAAFGARTSGGNQHAAALELIAEQLADPEFASTMLTLEDKHPVSAAHEQSRAEFIADSGMFPDTDVGKMAANLMTTGMAGATNADLAAAGYAEGDNPLLGDASRRLGRGRNAGSGHMSILSAGYQRQKEDSAGPMNRENRRLKGERHRMLDLVRLGGTQAGGVTAGLEDYLGGLTAEDMQDTVGTMRGMRQQMTAAGITDPKQIAKLSQMAGSGGYRAGGMLAVAGQNTIRASHAMGAKKGDFEGFVERLSGDFGVNLDAQSTESFKKDGVLTADSRAYFRTAAKHVINKGDAASELEIRHMTQELIESSQGFLGGNKEKGMDIADSLTSFRPMPGKGSTRSGKMLEHKLPELEEVVSKVVSGLARLAKVLNPVGTGE